jgi:hypothetical protein
MLSFTDGRDAGPLLVSHVSLLTARLKVPCACLLLSCLMTMYASCHFALLIISMWCALLLPRYTPKNRARISFNEARPIFAAGVRCAGVARSTWRRPLAKRRWRSIPAVLRQHRAPAQQQWQQRRQQWQWQQRPERWRQQWLALRRRAHCGLCRDRGAGGCGCSSVGHWAGRRPPPHLHRSVGQPAYMASCASRCISCSLGCPDPCSHPAWPKQ